MINHVKICEIMRSLIINEPLIILTTCKISGSQLNRKAEGRSKEPIFPRRMIDRIN